MTQNIHGYFISLKQKIAFVILLLFSAVSYSQTESFIRSFGADGFNYGLRIAVLQDTTYMLMGNKSGFENMNNVYLIHVDQSGHIIRDKVFGGPEMYVAADMTVSGDTMFIITGHTLNSTSQEYDVFVMWISKDLEMAMLKQYSAEGWDFGKAVAADHSGNVYVACESHAFGPKSSILLLHFSPDGNLTGNMLLSSPEAEEIPESMIIVDDSLLYLTGSIQPEQEPEQGFILKISTDFSTIDTLLCISDTLNIHYSDITQVGNDRISVTGYCNHINNPSKMLLYHSFDMDLTMNGVIWDNVQGTHCNCITSSAFGHTAFGCHTVAFGSGNADFHYFRFNHNTYLGASTVGGIMYDEPFDIAYALDSSLVMIGTTQSFGTCVTSIMFAKTCQDYFFCVNDYEHQTNVSVTQNEFNLSVFPNPSGDILNIRLPGEEGCLVKSVSVYSAEGKLCLHSCPSPFQELLQIDVSTLKSGFYIFIFDTSRGKFQKKIIKN